jgi:protein gp37
MDFAAIDETWNPVSGCLHNCTYCYGRKLAETKLKNIERYKDGFKPNLNEKELKKKFTKKFVFVSDMGDLFGDWVPREWILKVLEAISNSPSSYFLLLTKNPKRYSFFSFPVNTVLGTTIETNRDYVFSKAPSRAERYMIMRGLKHPLKAVSVEPIMDFDLDILASWIKEIKPALIHVGYDNWGNFLPEPALEKTSQLIHQLESFTRVKTLTLREKT